MNVLLLSMPDSFEHTATVTMRMPNGALASLAGNIDPHHRVAIADLDPRAPAGATDRRAADARARPRRRRPVDHDVSARHGPEDRGARARAQHPVSRIVVGGYDPSLASDVYEDPGWDVDVIVRGEGDLTFRELLRALEAGRGPSDIAGLSYRHGSTVTRNPDRPVSSLTGDDVALPNRGARVLDGYTFIGRPIDVVETSRGCTYDCSFCSIIEMRGRNFHTWSIDRVLADIADARARGARAIFIVDDNVTLNVARFEALCRAIVAAGFQDIDYLVQAMTSSIAARGDDARAADAGGRLPLRVPRHREHPRRGPGVPEGERQERAPRGAAGPVGNATTKAIDVLHRHGMYRRRRPDRRQSERYARVDRGQPRLRARARRLARISSTRHPIPGRR